MKDSDNLAELNAWWDVIANINGIKPFIGASQFLKGGVHFVRGIAFAQRLLKYYPDSPVAGFLRHPLEIRKPLPPFLRGEHNILPRHIVGVKGRVVQAIEVLAQRCCPKGFNLHTVYANRSDTNFRIGLPLLAHGSEAIVPGE
jgi:hypothetical protein